MKPKRVKDSMVTLSKIMQPSDANPRGIVHGGSVMKEIDNTAGAVAIKHSGRLVVTASVDRLDFHNRVFIGDLVTLMGSINMVGNSSMEIGIRVEAEDMFKGIKRHISSAYLTMVAVDSNGSPVSVSELVCESADEIRRNREAQKRKESRISQKAFETKCQSDPGNCR